MNNLLKYISVFILTLTLVNCEEYDPSVGVPQDTAALIGFRNSTHIIEVRDDNPVFQLTVTSNKATSSDRTVTVALDQVNSTFDVGDFDQVVSSITIPAGEYTGIVDITFDPDNLSTTDQRSFIYNIIEVPDGAMVNTSKEKVTVNYLKYCAPTDKVYVDFVFDTYASETSFRVYDESLSTVIVQGGGNYVDGQGPTTENFCLEDGTYNFVVFDAYGDGMWDGSVLGSFVVYTIAEDGSTNVLCEGDGNFSNYTIVPFTK